MSDSLRDRATARAVSQCRKGGAEFRFRHELFTRRIPQALREPPEMAFEIERSIAAVGPVVGCEALECRQAPKSFN